MEVDDVEKWLNRWILNYVNGNPNFGQAMKARYPLLEASWRGLFSLVNRPSTNKDINKIKIKLLDIAWCDLAKNLNCAPILNKQNYLINFIGMSLINWAVNHLVY